MNDAASGPLRIGICEFDQDFPSRGRNLRIGHNLNALERHLLFLESLRDLAEILCVRVKGPLWSPLNQRQIPSIMPKVSDGRHLHRLPLRGSCPFTHRERSEKERKMDRKALIITRNSVLGLSSLHSQHVRSPHGGRVPWIMETGTEWRRVGRQERPNADQSNHRTPKEAVRSI